MRWSNCATNSMSAPDLSLPLPDLAHENLRQAVVAAIGEAQFNASGVEDAYYLADVLFDLLGTALAAVDDLTARVEALEGN